MKAGVVGVIAQDTARFSMFGASLTGIEVPPGTGVKWLFGHDIAASTNLLVRAMFEEYEDADWLWILGDDHVFSGSILMRLLAHEKDIIVPLCLTRNPPYKPVVFSDWADVDERMRQRVHLPDHPEGGLIPIHSGGSAGMLIRRRVFEALEDPWFEHIRSSNVEIGEDVYFCDKAREAGFEIFCDLDIPMGHCTTATVWPVNEPGGWTYGFSFMGGLKLTMPSDAWDVADEVATAAGR